MLIYTCPTRTCFFPIPQDGCLDLIYTYLAPLPLFHYSVRRLLHKLISTTAYTTLLSSTSPTIGPQRFLGCVCVRETPRHLFKMQYVRTKFSHFVDAQAAPRGGVQSQQVTVCAFPLQRSRVAVPVPRPSHQVLAYIACAQYCIQLVFELLLGSVFVNIGLGTHPLKPTGTMRSADTHVDCSTRT